MNSSVAIHPRIMDRLEKTLLDRLRVFESERGKVRHAIESMLGRVIYLETAYGLRLARCRDECEQALREVDALDVYAQDEEKEIESLLRRFGRIASLLNDLDVNRPGT